MAAYFHVLDGRLRIKLIGVKGSPDAAQYAEQRTRDLPGVEQATANPVTGNLLVLYDVARTGPSEILAALHEWGYLRDRFRQPTTGVPGGRIAALVLRTTTEFALQRLITSLI